VRIESDERGRLRLDPERAALVKHVVAAGILEEINALEGAFPKKNKTAIDEIVERYGAPRFSSRRPAPSALSLFPYTRARLRPIWR
jgi:hypothetical protein